MDHDDSVLMGQLAGVNTRIARFILCALDGAANRPHRTSEDGVALGRDLVRLGKAVRQQARLRDAAWGHSYLEPTRGHARATENGSIAVSVVDGAPVGPAVCGVWLVADLPDPRSGTDVSACSMCLAALAQEP